MDLRLFEPGPLGLREQLLNRPLVQRFELDAARQLLAGDEVADWRIISKQTKKADI